MLLIFALVAIKFVYASIDIAGNPQQCFTKEDGRFLSGLARRVFTEEQEDDCLVNCLKAKIHMNFTCLSVQYYPAVKSENCVLNMENTKTKSKLVLEEQGVVYYENMCAGFTDKNDTESMSAVANISDMVVGNQSLIGYFNLVRIQKSNESVASLFTEEGLPVGAYSVYLAPAFSCATHSNQKISGADLPHFIQVGDVLMDKSGFLLGVPTPIQAPLSGPGSVIGQTVIFIEKSSDQIVACGILQGSRPSSALMTFLPSIFHYVFFVFLFMYYNNIF